MERDLRDGKTALGAGKQKVFWVLSFPSPEAPERGGGDPDPVQCLQASSHSTGKLRVCFAVPIEIDGTYNEEVTSPTIMYF